MISLIAPDCRYMKPMRYLENILVETIVKYLEKMSVKVLKESGLCCLSEVALVLSTGVTHVLFIVLVRVHSSHKKKRTSYLICVQQCIFLKIINPHFL